MCTVPTPRRFPGYSRSVPALLRCLITPLVDGLKICNRPTDSLRQRRGEQKGAGVSRGAAVHWREVQLHLPQRPRVHPHHLPLPHQLRGVHQAPVEHVQTTAGSRMPALPHQVPQGPHGQEGGDHRSLQRYAAPTFTCVPFFFFKSLRLLKKPSRL